MGPCEPEDEVDGDGAVVADPAPPTAGTPPGVLGVGVMVTNCVVVDPLITVVTEEVTPEEAAAVETGGRPTWTMTSTVSAISTGMA
jgi:hypothetical protein